MARFFRRNPERTEVGKFIRTHAQKLDRVYRSLERILPGTLSNILVFKSILLARKLYPVFLYAIYCGADRYLKKKRISAVLVWSTRSYPLMVRLACERNGIPVATLENGMLPGTVTMDFTGVNAYSSVPRNREFFMKLPESFEEKPSMARTLDVRQRHRSRRHAEGLETGVEKPFIFVPFQVPTDTQVALHSPLFTTMRALYEALVDAVREIREERPDFPRLVFKEHPSTPRRHLDAALYRRRDPEACFANDVPTQRLITDSEFIVTINSTVGVEGLLHDKKVMTLGDCCYNIDGLVVHVSGKEDLVSSLLNMKNFRPDEKLLHRYLNFLARVYVIPNREGHQVREKKDHEYMLERLSGNDEYVSMVYS